MLEIASLLNASSQLSLLTDMPCTVHATLKSHSIIRLILQTDHSSGTHNSLRFEDIRPTRT